MNNLVIVESPAKAKTIERILGKDFKVVSSFGHIRDLDKKNMGIDIENSFAPNYTISKDKKSLLQSLIKDARKTQTIWLATDEDREGEAIAWHLQEAISLKEKKFHRIVFNEITQQAITSAVQNPREIDVNLVNAQQARRVLDRIVGFKLSPVLWKKVKSGLSAGRVQSVSVRLIVDRENNIKDFKSKKSYFINAEFTTPKGELIKAEMINNLSTDKDGVRDLLSSFINSEFKVSSVEKKPSKSSSSPPFTTSSLQQAASNRLGFSVARTMSVAQKLYESGHITYMRTDSTNLSKEALGKMELYIRESFGEKYLKITNYSNKIKVAQEAHEAIRPTHFNLRECGNDDAQKKLYALIWERTICSQMADAIFDKTVINIIASNPDQSLFKSKGQVVKFDGYLKIHQELKRGSSKDVILPNLSKNEILNRLLIKAKEKYSKPPSRYTEASLVKKLEELGIGRPSTYAPTISTIQKREYVVKDDVIGENKQIESLILKDEQIISHMEQENVGSEKKKLIPTEVGKITNKFLVSNFENILDYNFTAKVEDEFDEIANGKKDWTDVISKFYSHFNPQVDKVDQFSDKVTGLRELGVDPVSKKKVYARLGKFGPIVQLGELNNNENSEKPKYAKIRKNQSIETIDLESALSLFSLPREIGQLNGLVVVVSEGKYGPYIKYNNKFISLKSHDPLTVDLAVCSSIIEEHLEMEKQKVINCFNKDENLIEVLNGKYGPYIKKNRKNYKIPKDIDPKSLTERECLNLISQSTKK